MKKVFVFPNHYSDSVFLMGIALSIMKKGVLDCECVMGSKQNIDMIKEQGYAVPDDVSPNDVILAIEAESDEAVSASRGAAEEMLLKGDRKLGRVCHDINDLPPGYDVVQISLPGQFALREAYKAIDKGLDVFMFTADISLEEERNLKEYARDHNKLMMGPDAGVGLLGGIAFAAGSIVKYGPVGVIGASGSGSQEVACLIEELGLGVTCILGTGGRDLKKAVGGISMLSNLQGLDRDEDTKLICLVSMLADREVMEKVLCEADKVSKPVVAVFLGADESLYAGHRVTGTYSLQDAAKTCVRLLTGNEPKLGWTDAEVDTFADGLVAALPLDKKYFRGLYTGGTFAEETLMTFQAVAPEVELYTNRDNTKYAKRLATHKVSRKHTLLDMGDLDFTAEAPHTVLDPEQRVRRLKQELMDAEVACIAMDIILGPGVARDPAMCYLPIMKDNPDRIYVCSVCGGEGDPQNKKLIRRMLAEAGAIVADSNYESARLCAKICQKLEGRRI